MANEWETPKSWAEWSPCLDEDKWEQRDDPLRLAMADAAAEDCFRWIKVPADILDPEDY